MNNKAIVSIFRKSQMCREIEKYFSEDSIEMFEDEFVLLANKIIRMYENENEIQN